MIGKDLAHGRLAWLANAGKYGKDKPSSRNASMIRRMSSVVSGLSTALFIVAVALWLDSFNRHYGAVYLPDHPRSYELYAVRGAVAADITDLQYARTGVSDATRLKGTIVDLQPDDVAYYADLGFAGGKCGEFWFHFVRYSTPVTYNTTPVKQRTIVFPMWFAALLFALLPARSLKRRYVARSRRAAARCVSCGYDLRASTGRCPECGTPILPKGVA